MRKLNGLVLMAVTALVGCSAGTANAQSSCAALGGVSDADGACHIAASTSSYTMDIRFPLNFADEQAVIDYIAQNRDGFVNVAQTPGPRGAHYEMDVTSEWFTSAAPAPGTQSVVLKLFQDVGGIRPVTWYKAFSYNLAQKRPITFDTLFAPWSNPLVAIFPIVQHELERQTGLVGRISLGDGLDPSHYQNFAITDTAVIFYFGQGELLPVDAGATSASVPRSAIPPLQL
jgi:hypothetical protein